MKKTFTAPLMASFIGFCLMASGSAWAAGQKLAENEAIARVVEQTLPPNLAKIVLESDYDGFYEINGSMRRGGDYRFTRIKDKTSFPDNRWEDVAKEVTERVDFETAAKTLGGRRSPKATAYVVMFKGGLDGVKHGGTGESLALIMIEPEAATKPDVLTGAPSGEALYLLDVSMN